MRGGGLLQHGQMSGEPRRIHEPAAPSRSAPSWLGKRVGRFKLLGLLGRGAYGRVFLAEDTDLHRRVALKVVTPDAAAKAVQKDAAEEGTAAASLGADTAERLGRQTVDQLVREARAAARLEHPGIVTVFEVGQLPAPGGAGMGGFIAMELAEGGTLQELVDAAGPLDIRRACTLVAEAAEALQSAHDVGVVHRDVKPANLMLARNGRVKVADFGLAAIDDPSDGHRYRRLVGTAAYVAPEVVLGNASDEKSDQYSLAATLFALLAGRPPYVGSRRDVLDAHVNKAPPSLSAVRPDVDDRLAAVLQRAMTKDPGGRFASIGRFGTALRVFTVPSDADMAAPARQPAADALSHQASNHTAIRSALEALDSGRIPTGSGLSVEGLASMLDSAAIAGLQRRRRRRQVGTLVGVCAGVAVVVALVSLAFVQGRQQARADTREAEPSAASSNAGAAQNSLPPAPVVAESARPVADDDEPAPAAVEPTGFPPRERLAAYRESRPPARREAAPTGEPGTVSPLDYDGLVAIANGENPAHPDGVATVEGVVSYARTSSSGKVFRLYFEGSQRGRSFAVIWFPQTFPAMEEAFGGENGSGLFRERIRVTGTVELAPGEAYPEIIVTDPDQVTVVERPDPQDEAPPEADPSRG